MEELRKLLEGAKKLYRSEDYEEAEEIYKDIAEKLEGQDNPEAVEIRVKALAGIGGCLREQLFFDEAIPYYEAAMKLDPENSKVLIGLADSYRGLKDWDKAMDFWKQALDLQPDDYLIITRIGDAYRKKMDFGNAEKYYLRALALNPRNKFALMGIGGLNYKHKKYDKALQ